MTDGIFYLLYHTCDNEINRMEKNAAPYGGYFVDPYKIIGNMIHYIVYIRQSSIHWKMQKTGKNGLRSGLAEGAVRS